MNAAPQVHWKRTLRTASSERLLATEAGADIAAADLHYLYDGTVAGTVTLLRTRTWSEAEIDRLLHALDDDFLPHVDLDNATLTLTVVLAEVLGNYEPDRDRTSVTHVSNNPRT